MILSGQRLASAVWVGERQTANSDWSFISELMLALHARAVAVASPDQYSSFQHKSAESPVFQFHNRQKTRRLRAAVAAVATLLKL